MSNRPLPRPPMPPRPQPPYGLKPQQPGAPPPPPPPRWQAPPPAFAPPTFTPPAFAPPYGPPSTAERNALVRPWQVTLYGWLVVIGSVVTLIAIIPLMFINDSTLISLATELDSQSDITVQNLDTARTVIIVADIVTAIIVAINLPLGIAFLRGRRGAYLYFSTMLWLNIAAVVAGVILMVVLLGLGFLVTANSFN